MQNTDALKIAWLPQYMHKSNGYGFIAGRLARALRDADVELVERSRDDWNLRVLVGIPTQASIGRSQHCGEDIVYHTMFEGRPLPDVYASALNRCRAAWVPSTFCRDLFVEHGVNVPIIVSPYGVDRDIFTPVARKFDEDRPLRFGVWAHSWTDRKGAIAAVRSYLRADVDNCELSVKLQAPRESNRVQVDGVDREDITVYTSTWPLERLVKWLQSLDVLLYLSGGEGFGLQPLEAMSTGAVVIAANNTGMREYLRPGENCIAIDGDGTFESYRYEQMFGNQRFEFIAPNESQTVEAIRFCAGNRSALFSYSDAAIATASQFNWSNAGAIARERLSTLIS